MVISGIISVRSEIGGGVVVTAGYDHLDYE